MKKTILIITLSAIALIAIGYGLYVLYDIVMTDATARLKEAISEGIQEGITSAINPLNWPQALLRAQR